MKRVSIWLLLSIFLANASLEALAESGCGESFIPPPAEASPTVLGAGRARPSIWACLMVLGLDEKQIRAIRGIEHRIAKEMVRKRAELRIAELELADMLNKGGPDMSAVEAMLKNIGSVEAGIRLSAIRANREAEALLAPEQQKD